MPLPVVFTQEFSSELEKAVAYLSENWSNQVKVDFLVVLAEKIQRIEAMPESYPISAKTPGVRRCLVNRQMALYYRIKENYVEALSIRSTRRDDNL